MIYGVTGMWGANKLGIIKYRIKNVKIFLIAIIWLFILMYIWLITDQWQ